MEFAEVTIKESPGLCRCCLSEGCYKDLGTEYTWMNETEVYADMLLDCFDIGISQHNDGPNGPKRLICEVCITRLRDACNFKKQVLDSEKKFIDMLGRGEFRPMEKQTVLLPIYTSQTPMKAEAIEEVTVTEDYDDSNVEFLDDIDYNEDEDAVKAESKPPQQAVASTSAKRGRPRKTDAEPPEKKLKGKPKTTKIPKGGKTLVPVTALEAASKSSMSSSKRNRFQKQNATIILQSCTAIPFKWHRQFYMCFYCHKQYERFDDLKVHSKVEHAKPNVKSCVSYLRADDKVKIDIMSLSCKLCHLELCNLEALIDHLKNTHSMVFADVGYGVIPYKHTTDSYECAICSERFAYFMMLNRHMNTHFGQYVCETCGKSFLSSDRLRVHALLHGKVRCDDCPETFSSATSKHAHVSKVHNKSKVKCLHCPETFSTYIKRKVHHRSVHNVGSLHGCPVCGKEFSIKSRMQVHLKEVHYKETNFDCTVCDKSFFQNWQLTKHMVKHVGEKVHHCDICQKSFARSSTLSEHMNTHRDRSVCAGVINNR